MQGVRISWSTAFQQHMKAAAYDFATAWYAGQLLVVAERRLDVESHPAPPAGAHAVIAAGSSAGMRANLEPGGSYRVHGLGQYRGARSRCCGLAARDRTDRRPETGYCPVEKFRLRRHERLAAVRALLPRLIPAQADRSSGPLPLLRVDADQFPSFAYTIILGGNSQIGNNIDRVP